MQNKSNHQKFEVTRKWVFDGSLFSLMTMSVIVYLLHVNGIEKTSDVVVVWIVSRQQRSKFLFWAIDDLWWWLA